MPYWGRVWEDAVGRGCHSAPCESPTATARCIGDVLAVGPHREHALSQATFWASQALALLLAGRNVHSRLEPKVPKVPPTTSPSCPPGSAWLSAYLPACRCCVARSEMGTIGRRGGALHDADEGSTSKGRGNDAGIIGPSWHV
jgi:hypothetical protein